MNLKMQSCTMHYEGTPKKVFFDVDFKNNPSISVLVEDQEHDDKVVLLERNNEFFVIKIENERTNGLVNRAFSFVACGD